MEYFMTHIIYIVLAAVVIAAIACAWGFMTYKADQQKAQEGEEPAAGCGLGCSGCNSFSSCSKPEKKA
jgi:hypothetical protein